MLLSQYLPPFLANTDVLSNILKSEQIEINSLNTNAEDIVNQCFVTTATWGLNMWEDFVGISTDTTKDYTARRSAILAKLRGYGAINATSIGLIASSFSNGTVQVTESPSTYSFNVKFVSTMGIPSNISDLQNIINQIKPAHLAVTYTFTYQQWSAVKTATWTTAKTGSWGDVMNGVVV